MKNKKPKKPTKAEIAADIERVANQIRTKDDVFCFWMGQSTALLILLNRFPQPILEALLEGVQKRTKKTHRDHFMIRAMQAFLKHLPALWDDLDAIDSDTYKVSEDDQAMDAIRNLRPQ
jgi:hypothetical protein